MEFKDFSELTYEEKMKQVAEDRRRQAILDFERSIDETIYDYKIVPPKQVREQDIWVREYKPLSFATKAVRLVGNWRESRAAERAKKAKADQGPQQWVLPSGRMVKHRTVRTKEEQETLEQMEEMIPEEDRCFELAARMAERREAEWAANPETAGWRVTEDDVFVIEEM